MAAEKIEEVKKVSRTIESFKRAMERNFPQGAPPDREYFDTLMRQDVFVHRPGDVQLKSGKDAGIDGQQAPSLIDLVDEGGRRRLPSSEYTSRDLITQAKDAVSQIEELQKQLGAPGTRVKGTAQGVLKNKLQGIGENLKAAFGRAGIEYEPTDGQGRAIGNPIVRFLDLLANGQYNLQKLSGHVEGMAAKGKDLSPADLLALQLKVHHVQQELEFFTALLNKSLESTKTLMNVQV